MYIKKLKKNNKELILEKDHNSYVIKYIIDDKIILSLSDDNFLRISHYFENFSNIIINS